jgi:hypothetical protein
MTMSKQFFPFDRARMGVVNSLIVGSDCTLIDGAVIDLDGIIKYY